MTPPDAAADLIPQAIATAEAYFSAAIQHIDAACGAGYATAHPDLIAAFMRACERDLHTAVLLKALSKIAAAIERLSDDDVSVKLRTPRDTPSPG
jgi:hypothetical protein